MRRRILIAYVILLAGCDSLFNLDHVGKPEDATSLDDGATPVSCETLAPTCGPTSMSPCCESPEVTGGMFYRSYDVSGDGTYPSMAYPATVTTFRLDKYEVTVGRFRQFVIAGMGTQSNPPQIGAGGRMLNGLPNQGGWDAAWNASLTSDMASLVAAVKCDATYQTWTDTTGNNENRPMNCITWYEAMAFCVWDGGYLPTDAQWHYAASGGSEQRAYPWSMPASFLGIDSMRASFWVDATKQCFGDGVSGCAGTDLVPVGSKPAGDGLWLQSDLGGNVSEWMLDWSVSPYPVTNCVDCATLTPSSSRVRRSGSFRLDAPTLRAAWRGAIMPGTRNMEFGVRCAR
jgi:formylglycine-generating enzyme required for sulfatase activity